MKIIRVGVDLAKNVFQVHGVDRHEKPVWRRRLSRAEWVKVLLNMIEPGCEIGMEACGGAHHWARQLQRHGITFSPTTYFNCEPDLSNFPIRQFLSRGREKSYSRHWKEIPSLCE